MTGTSRKERQLQQKNGTERDEGQAILNQAVDLAGCESSRKIGV